jgi:Kdo2-lipid IVA lauroyltransferase/acyltransferase
MYYIIYGLLYLLSWLPMGVIHAISSSIAWLVGSVIGYRRQVVMNNLAIAFPEKSAQERKAIAREFYRNFTDSMLESIKLLSMSDEEIARRFIGSGELLNRLMEMGDGRNVQLHAMHNFNWEIVHLGLAKQLRHPFLGVYGPISNPVLERIFFDLRSRFGTVLIPAPRFRTHFKDYAKERYILALVADQSPANPAKAWWIDFFSKRTGWVTGPESGAKAKGVKVVFGTFFKVKRGYYSFEMREVEQDPRSMAEGELTEMYVRFVEECIRKRPANYLWSHRRWKHEYKEEYASRVVQRKDKAT